MIRLLLGGFFIFLFTSCSSEPRYLYPSELSQQIRYICTTVFEPKHSENQLWKKSLPDIVTITSDEVTVYFMNHRSYSFPKESGLLIPSGSYHCN